MLDCALLLPPDDDRYCVIHQQPGNLKNMALPSRGKSIVGLADDVRDYQMSKEAKGLQVADVIRNTFGYLMASERMKKAFESHVRGAQIEYLPFRLLNHKGRMAADPCFIVNVLGTVDCADKSLSRGVETAVYKGEFFIARRLVLVESRVPKDANVFRTSLFPPGIWVGGALRSAMEKQGMAARFVASGEDI